MNHQIFLFGFLSYPQTCKVGIFDRQVCKIGIPSLFFFEMVSSSTAILLTVPSRDCVFAPAAISWLAVGLKVMPLLALVPAEVNSPVNNLSSLVLRLTGG